MTTAKANSNYLKEIDVIDLEANGTVYHLAYRKPGFAQLSYLIQWIIEGFAPTFLSKDKMDSMTADEQFEESLKYLTGAYQNFTEEQQAKLWGSAVYASKASINYLFPVVEQCFPGVSLFELKDEVLDACTTKVISDYFNSIAQSQSQS
jgi:hypothetical protein